MVTGPGSRIDEKMYEPLIGWGEARTITELFSFEDLTNLLSSIIKTPYSLQILSKTVKVCWMNCLASLKLKEEGFWREIFLVSPITSLSPLMQPLMIDVEC